MNPPDNEGDAGSIAGQEDPLEKEMATHFSILGWEIPWTVAHQAPLSMGFPMDRGAWWATVHGATKESDVT